MPKAEVAGPKATEPTGPDCFAEPAPTALDRGSGGALAVARHSTRLVSLRDGDGNGHEVALLAELEKLACD